MVKKALSSYITFLIAIWVLLVSFLPWRGFFMLNDDYAYIFSTQNYSLFNFSVHPIVSTTIIFQSFLGKIVLYIFNGDISYLRLLTSIFLLIGAICLYLVLANKQQKFVSFFISLLFLFNPLSINLGFTFMTDVYYVSLLLLSLFFIHKYFKTNNFVFALLCGLFLAFMFLTRQIGLVYGVFFILSCIYFKKMPIKKALLVFIPLAFAFVLYQFFYTKPLGFTSQSLALTLTKLQNVSFLKEVLLRPILSLYYFGFFTLPLTFAFGLNLLFNLKKQYKLIIFSIFTFTLFSFISILLWVFEKQVMFYIPNIISYAGFNPSNINDGIKQTVFVNSPFLTRVIYTFLSIVSLSLFTTYIYTVIKKLKTDYLFLIMLVPSILSLGLAFIFRDFFDRYLLMILPVLLYPFVYLKISKIAKGFLVLLTLTFAITFTLFQHDYLSLNKTMWEVANTPPLNFQNTHASFEYNNYYNLQKSLNITNGTELFKKNWTPKKETKKFLISYTDTWVYCRYKQVEYPSFISKHSLTKGSFNIMVRGSEPFDPTKCKNIVKTLNN